MSGVMFSPTKTKIWPNKDMNSVNVRLNSKVFLKLYPGKLNGDKKRRVGFFLLTLRLKTKGVMDRRWSRKADRGGNECRWIFHAAVNKKCPRSCFWLLELYMLNWVWSQGVSVRRGKLEVRASPGRCCSGSLQLRGGTNRRETWTPNKASKILFYFFAIC